MEQRSTWGASPSPQSKSGEITKEKIPYVAAQRTNDKMSDSQKEGVRVWNLMVSTLRENGLMEDKQ